MPDPPVTRVLLVAGAGAVGVAARYLLGVTLARPGFPWVTLGINLLGSLLLGALVASTFGRERSVLLLAVLGTGALGGFTTFSAFSVETLALLHDGRHGAAAAYATASLLGGVAAAWIGFSVVHR